MTIRCNNQICNSFDRFGEIGDQKWPFLEANFGVENFFFTEKIIKEIPSSGFGILLLGSTY